MKRSGKFPLLTNIVLGYRLRHMARERSRQARKRPPPQCFDRDNRPISVAKWLALIADDEYRLIAHARFRTIDVSTVWIGLDFNGGRRNREPIVFQTTVTLPIGITPEVWRWSTYAEAMTGHWWAIENLRYRGYVGLPGL